ncbi:Protein of unknown function [bacterium A37T11]|nr:Protein of unknown function [bacterium A37T11]
MEALQPVDVQVEARKIAIVNGLILAAINIFIFLLVYYAAPNLMGNMAYSIIQLVVGIALAVYFTLNIRKKIGGYWSFKEALSAIFVLFIINVVVVYFVTLAFGKFIEPGYPEKMKEIVLNGTTDMMEKISQDQDAIDKTIEEVEKSLDSQFNPGIIDVLKSLCISVIMYFIGALVFAAIFKRDKPIFFTTDETEA